MMNHKNQFRSVLLAVISAGLLACGGGGGSSGGGAAAGGTGGTGSGGTGGGTGGGSGGGTGTVNQGGLVSGGAVILIDTGGVGVELDVASGGSGASVDLVEIDAFGSLIYDGQTVNTDSAVFTAEGQAASQSDLRQGQSVMVITDAAGSNANGVHYRSNVKGPASSVTIIDPVLGQAELVILGQTVRSNATTAFSDVGVDGLLVGDFFEVSGTQDANGVIEATFIERKATLSEYKVTGVLANLTATTFTINGLTVDYGSATLQDFDAAIADGDIVEVRGPSGNFTSPDQLSATEVELLPAVTVGDSVAIQIDGYVDRFVSASDFDVQTVSVTTDGSTTFTNGSAASIALGVKLKIVGTIQSDGTLLAGSITVQPTNAIRAEGNIEAIDTVAGTVTLLDVTFSTRDLLRLEDDSSVGLDPLNFSDLGIGDEVEIRGFLDGSEVVATRIDRDDARDRARLRGPVSAEDATNNTVTILGVVLTGQSGVTEYQDANDNVITASQFYDQVDVGDFVRGRWDIFTDTSQTVDELSIED